jgi:DNA-binding response OmpR family regulator
MGVAMVDDEEDACLMAESIVANARWLVWLGSCPSGDKAVAAIPGMKPTVVLMDIRMPGMSGFECARRLLAVAPTLVIVMVTAWGEVANLDQGLRVGATAFLCKPYTPAQLLATIRFSVKPTWPLRFM